MWFPSRGPSHLHFNSFPIAPIATFPVSIFRLPMAPNPVASPYRHPSGFLEAHAASSMEPPKNPSCFCLDWNLMNIQKLRVPCRTCGTKKDYPPTNSHETYRRSLFPRKGAPQPPERQVPCELVGQLHGPSRRRALARAVRATSATSAAATAAAAPRPCIAWRICWRSTAGKPRRRPAAAVVLGFGL